MGDRCLRSLLVAAAAVLCLHVPTACAEETLTFGRFGTVHLYRESPQPSRAVLFASGDGGWNLGVIDMARSLASLDTLVVGIDVTHYLRELARSGDSCSYPAADFEGLSHYVQKKLDLERYSPPVLVGYSSGATLVYAVLVQAPPGTFAGAISLGFCPDLPLSKPFCKGSGLAWEQGPKGKGVSFLPAAGLEAPWVAFQGAIDQVCDPAATVVYAKKIPGAEIVLLPKVGHGFSVQKNWMPQFREAFSRVARKASGPPSTALTEVADLPLVEVPSSRNPAGPLLAVILSGDGGWAGLDREVAGALAAKGVPVVGWNSLQYYWRPRTPEGAAQDLARILRHYLASWRAEEAVLVGYSLGADVLPFLVNRLPADLRKRVRLVALLGPAERASFEFRLSDWLGGPDSGSRPVLPEVERLAGTRVLCLYGKGEEGALCPRLDASSVEIAARDGGHHFAGDYQGLAEEILRAAR
ncbi:MAG: virulence factor family protein [Proteobacteria bacterium]|nr:virulence factor family protein [Pseudomonadota bacterium]